MSVVASDLLDPVGDIDASMFPSDDAAGLLVRVGQYLTRSLALIADSPALLDTRAQDAAAKAYVYYLANAAVYRRLSSQPLSLSLQDAGARVRSQAQIEHFNVQATKYLARFNDLIPSPVTPIEGVNARVTATRNTVLWK